MVVSGSLNRWDWWYTIPQLAVYTTYIPLIFLASWLLLCYRSHLLREPGFTPLIKWWISQPAILVYRSVTFWKTLMVGRPKFSPRKNPIVDRTVTSDQVFPNHGQSMILQQVGCEATCWKLERLVGYTLYWIYTYFLGSCTNIYIYIHTT